MIYVNTLLEKNILNEPEIICLHTVKWFQAFLSNSDDSI